MVDVTVMGAGAFGLAVAWACVKRGAKVRVIDPNGVAAGSSGGIVGALAPHTPENWNPKKAFQFESLIMAESYWAEIEESGGAATGYGRLGRLQPIADEKALALAEQRAESAKDLWQGKAKWQIISAAESASTYQAWMPGSRTGQLIYDTLSARIHPRMACKALALALQERGAELVTSGQVQGLQVWATGWEGLVALTQQHHRLVGNGVKGQAALFKLDRRDLPQLYVDTLHIIPHADGTVAVGSTSERDFQSATTPDAQLEVVIERAIAALPALAEAQILERWAGVRPRARSRAPMLGRHPFDPDAFIANGGFKIGFGMAPKAGEVMADLILNDVDQIPEDFKPEASL